jgi:hypothetical protein
VSQDPVFWEVAQTQDGKTVLSNPQLQNSYSYSRNNPVLYKDPDGRLIEQATIENKGMSKNGGSLLNKSAAGSIFEVAGRKTKATAGRTSSAQFLRNLGNRFGKASRVVWRVVDKDKAKIEKNVEQALNDAKAQLQRYLNKERG